MTKDELLDAARQAVSDRGLNYGRPEDNFARIAALWNAYLGNKGMLVNATNEVLEGPDVALLLALVKVARLQNSPTHEDSWVDIAGYAACGADLTSRKTPA